jgi:hypothetical protein
MIEPIKPICARVYLHCLICENVFLINTSLYSSSRCHCSIGKCVLHIICSATANYGNFPFSSALLQDAHILF